MSTRPVLLIDDDAASSERICRLLASHGFTVAATATGAAAIERLDTLEVPAAVLINFSSPAADTQAFYTAIREVPPFDRVPLVKINGATALEYLPILLDDSLTATRRAA